MKVAVYGAGAWGTALAMAAAQRHDVLLWARDAELVRQMQASRRNARYLGQVVLPPTLRVTHDAVEAQAHGEDGLNVIATPMAALRQQLLALPSHRPVLWLCKGFEAGTGALGHEVARQLRPHAAGGVLSGPSFALEVARGQPTALVVASESAELTATAVDVLHADALRVYTSADVVGVEVGGAVKNVLAIAVGVLDGLADAAPPDSDSPGLNARAALITRGLAEMTRLGVALGARAETFMGLSGLGDLVLTATGHLSRNRRIGLLLAGGQPLDSAVASLGHVAEGVLSAPVVLARARALGVDMPITQTVVDLLQGGLAPAQAVARLMSRHARSE